VRDPRNAKSYKGTKFARTEIEWLWRAKRSQHHPTTAHARELILKSKLLLSLDDNNGF
jgi:hypothetical protein